MSTTSPPPVSVLGLGAMGTALATAFLASGHPTTVWNRTSARADRLVASGATAAPSAADAVAASDLTVLCLLDRDAVDAVLDDMGGGLEGATVVNLTSSTPDDARATAVRVAGAGGRYLDGKIMVPTPLIGTDDSLVLYSGDAQLFAEHRDALGALGGEADLVGDDPGLAALYDLGMLGVFFNGMTAFLHAAALVGADGVPASTFLPYADRIVEVLRATLPGLAADADRGEHPGDEDNLEMEGAALDHVVHASAQRGLDTTVPGLPRALVRSAIARGHGRDGFSRVIDLLRPPAGVHRAGPLAPLPAKSL
jgi:3-hydroxyisobutyrate dehydrogenase-like beta-hydroxyacid dehydrogenase